MTSTWELCCDPKMLHNASLLNFIELVRWTKGRNVMGTCPHIPEKPCPWEREKEVLVDLLQTCFLCLGVLWTGVPLGGSSCGAAAGPQPAAAAQPVLWCGAGGWRPAGPCSQSPAGCFQPILPRYVHLGHERGTAGGGSVHKMLQRKCPFMGKNQWIVCHLCECVIISVQHLVS